MEINVVLNSVRKEYWVAGPQYNNEIDYYIKQLKTIYGDNYIQSYLTDSAHLNEDLKTDIHRGYTESHYTDWITIKNKE